MLKRILTDNTVDDLQALIDNQVPESVGMDYKRELFLGADAQKQELLEDITSLANAAGGDLIVGMAEAKDANNRNLGYPTAKDGIELPSLDHFKQQVESTVQSGAQPRVRGLQFHPIPVANGKHVVIVRVPKSFTSPHLVIKDAQRKFYTRNSVGKVPMEWMQIRDAFLGTNTLDDRINQFRLDRIGKIAAGESPIELSTGKFILHMLPTDGFINGAASRDALYAQRNLFQLLYQGTVATRFNYDGVLSITRSGAANAVTEYAQYYTTGAIEAVISEPMIGPNANATPPESVVSVQLDMLAIRAVSQYMRLYMALDIPAPVLVGFALVNVRGYTMGRYNPVRDDRRYAADRDTILLPTLEFETLETDEGVLAAMMKPMIEALWYAFSRWRCDCYDENGLYNPDRLQQLDRGF